MKERLSVDGHIHQPYTDPAESRLAGDAERITGPATIRLRYMLPDCKENWRGRLMQKIVDRLHKGED